MCIGVCSIVEKEFHSFGWKDVLKRPHNRKRGAGGLDLSECSVDLPRSQVTDVRQDTNFG